MELSSEEIEFINELRNSKQSLVCNWCTIKIEDVYYKCQQHKTIFCADCARNFGLKEITSAEAPCCPQHKMYKTDCILELKNAE